MDKEYTGLWIPKEILANKDLTHVEKMVWSMAHALPKGLRMADSTIAEQLGIGQRNAYKVLSSLVSKGWLKKSGSHKFRAFFATTPTGVIVKSNYTSQRSQLHPEGQSTTPTGVHKEYKTKEIIEEKKEFDMEAWEAQRINMTQRNKRKVAK